MANETVSVRIGFTWGCPKCASTHFVSADAAKAGSATTTKNTVWPKQVYCEVCESEFDTVPQAALKRDADEDPEFLG